MPKKQKQSAEPALHKYFLWFALLEVIVIFAIGWLALLQPQWQTISSYNDSQHDLVVSQLAQKETQLQDLMELETELNALSEERLQYAQRVLPVGLEPTDMIARLEYMGEQVDVTLSSVDVVRGTEVIPAASADNGATQEFTDENIRTGLVTMSVQTNNGTYAELKNFLEALESFTPVLDLQTLQYTAGTDTFALQLQTYYLEPEEL